MNTDFKMRYKLIFFLILIASVVGCRGSKGEVAVVDPVMMLSAELDSNFERALFPNAIEFPRDFGAHDGYRTEWWYYTGHLVAADEREFGFQFTIFRTALSPSNGEEAGSSEWRSNQLYLAHFAISDVKNGDFYFSERNSRGAVGLAGATADPYTVWVENWSIEAQGERVHLQADAGDYALDLDLTQTLAPILHGDGGLSPKSEQAGNASYYYSQIHQQASGSVRVADGTFAVTGEVWKDHEYSTSALSPDAAGWDWVSLQFNDGSALMLFEIRNQNGGVEAYSSGSWVSAEGDVTALTLSDWQLTATDHWRSPKTAAVYPVAWTLTIPSQNIELSGSAKMPNQELTLPSATYWEGAVAFSGTRNGNPIRAHGYIELTGYQATP